jgi:hypothetical protein
MFDFGSCEKIIAYVFNNRPFIKKYRYDIRKLVEIPKVVHLRAMI